MLVDHLFQYGISPGPQTAEERGFCTSVTDGPMDGRTDGQTLIQRCENASKNVMEGWTSQQADGPMEQGTCSLAQQNKYYLGQIKSPRN